MIGNKTQEATEYLTIPALADAPGLLHAFTTRKNGLGSRDNGLKSPSDWQTVAASFHIPCDRLVTLSQVHGDRIVSVDSSNRQEAQGVQADALITREPGIAVGVETADCVPLLLFAPRVRAVGAVHAGWRGTVARIVQKTVARMRDEFGTDPTLMTAAVGPAIGPECYEVDEPVMSPVRTAFPFWREVTAGRGNDRWSLDLAALNRLELINAGLRPENVHALGLCTSCRQDLFYSYRREGRTGRMLSAIMLVP